MTAPVVRSIARRTRGRSSRPARSTVQIKVPNQSRSKQTITVPIASAAGSTLAPGERNCGNSAMKKTASLGFASPAISPGAHARAGARQVHRVVRSVQQRADTEHDEDRGPADPQHVVRDL